MASRSSAAPLVLSALLTGASGASAVRSLQEGPFLGRVIVEWLHPDGGPARDMRLVESFGFRDPAGTEWTVPDGTVVNGASIPRVLWTLVGSPFIGNYRRASVIHDYYCQARSRPWQAVHRMFYEAMLAGGVSPSRAKTMYGVVYASGPRWDPSGTAHSLGAHVMREDEVRELERWIREADPLLTEIESRVMGRHPR